MRVFVLLILVAFVVRLVATAWLGFDRAPVKDEVGYIAVVNHPCQRNATIFRNSGATRVVCGSRAAEKWHNIFTTAEPAIGR